VDFYPPDDVDDVDEVDYDDWHFIYSIRVISKASGKQYAVNVFTNKGPKAALMGAAIIAEASDKGTIKGG
jgi:hypothetical protein